MEREKEGGKSRLLKRGRTNQPFPSGGNHHSHYHHNHHLLRSRLSLRSSPPLSLFLSLTLFLSLYLFLDSLSFSSNLANPSLLDYSTTRLFVPRSASSPPIPFFSSQVDPAAFYATIFSLISPMCL